VVALVGYTNAGKSTLFNALTGAGVYAQDQLFATLDPTMRQIRLPSGRTAILSDTVGFISELPTQLVEAFRATLEEVASADIILHVRDAAHPDTQAQRADVLHVLADMAEGAEAALDEEWQARVIEVLNKADLLPEGQLSGMAVSALNGDGLEALLAVVDGRLGAGEQESLHRIDAGDGARIAWLHRHAEVLETIMEDDVLTLRVRMSATARARFAQLPPMDEAGPISANDP
jgi:GTP-binding protein HflX